MSPTFRAIPVTNPPDPKDVYPREGCPECNGAVEPVLIECDLGEEHERWECQNPTCYEDEIREEDLVTVTGSDEAEETLDAARLLKDGKVLPSMVEWVKAQVAS